jgi:hypothetical protein
LRGAIICCGLEAQWRGSENSNRILRIGCGQHAGKKDWEKKNGA